MGEHDDLQRFVEAQAPVYARVLDELHAGRKQTHWIWFVFPQIEGLGHSATAQRYAIASRQEAAAYLAHPVLGARLRECTALVNAVEGRSVHDIFGHPDDMKFHSSMTLFAEVSGDDAPFLPALEKYFGGARDDATLTRL
ncbi:MAG: DUF1810 domain-containing protein [Afipia sp.]|nr:DUF1810 domain-containing protein [Afipia sp.]OJW63152.1 MAG: calpastatin [Afipia sp. 64-13]